MRGSGNKDTLGEFFVLVYGKSTTGPERHAELCAERVVGSAPEVGIRLCTLCALVLHRRAKGRRE